ncbi:Protein BREAST CANCER SUSCEPTIBILITY [Ananas comosus]|uniref:Protein BREAST CANCER SUSCEPTIBILITY n=1 Tax=Ananas comosus TaxID=4615 RepID=A0A199VS58_ANACO|nr:Protein BREAST CANCER SUSCEPTIBILITY [Ananas comosus]
MPITHTDQALAEPSDQLPAISIGVNDKNGEKVHSNILLKAQKRSKTSSLESHRKRIKGTSDDVKYEITEGIPTGSVSKRKMGRKNSMKMKAVPEFLDDKSKDGKDSCIATAAKGTKIVNRQKHDSKTCGRTARAKRMISPATMDSAVLRNNAVSERSDTLAVRKLKKDGESIADCVLKKCENTSEVVCAFCKSADITEDSGEMMHYFNGKPVAAAYSGGTNVIHSHKNCTEWAPDVYFEDDSAINLAAELARSRRIKCIVCGIKGAALGCFEKSCRKSFHYTCAKLIPECCWDNENFVMLCPLHWSSKLPIETSEAQKQIKRTSSKGSIAQVPSARDSGYDTSNLWSWPSGSPCKWVLCCSALSNKEKEIVSQFTKMTGVPLTKTWSPAVTHVITSTDGSGACKRTLKFLMAILNGKWIVNINWIRICMEAMEPVDEEKFEITVDVHGISGGPKLGRLKAINKEPKLFNGLRFYFSGDFVLSYRGYLQDLVTAAGGTVLQRKPISRDQQKLLDDSSLTFIIYSLEHPEKSNSNRDSVVFDLLRAKAKALADACGGKIASNTWVIDSIAACKLQPLT